MLSPGCSKFFLAIIAIAFFSCSSVFAVEPPGIDAPRRRQTPPYPPPDPAMYTHAAVLKSNYGGIGIGSFWIFEPAEPKPKKAPVIAFIPGYSVENPINYGAWFDHLVKQGNVVLFISYMETARTRFTDLTDNAFSSLQKAIEEVKNGYAADGSQHVEPDFDRFSIAGHSTGAIIAANLAARNQMAGLPQPKAIFAADPGRTALIPGQGLNGGLMRIEDLSQLPADTLLLSVYGDKDRYYGMRGQDAVLLLAAASSLPMQNRLLYFLQSVGLKGERATHFYPSAPNEDYDNGQAAGLNLVPQLPRLSRAINTFTTRAQAQLILDSLDYELWRLFDEARAVRFDDATWSMPVIPFNEIDTSKIFVRSENQRQNSIKVNQ
jgi:hypothetical protein